ncbi:OSJNBa0010H02.21-like protein [Zea mays]|uniref:OSJNBa0010H02.21-like protein n=1 Tax=Zea mays TaxID=4577 RepID=A0A1D6JD48_MAIZE|nr:OSJNBa0010H02.21-like protein [Zea mays]
MATVHVLELQSKFLPYNNNKIFDIMNLLEDRLQHANGVVVLATIKVFLHSHDCCSSTAREEGRQVRQNRRREELM